jgi:hypothetical protein
VTSLGRPGVCSGDGVRARDRLRDAQAASAMSNARARHAGLDSMGIATSDCELNPRLETGPTLVIH